jgi:muramidase (phage lysozyme)
MTPNEKAFLDMIAFSEIGPKLLAASDNGYNVIVGSTPEKPLLFDGYDDHPRLLIDLGRGLKSTAAGRYQLLARYFDFYKKLLHLPDFSPASQDAIALQQIREGRALDDVQAGRFEVAVGRVKNIWASFPGAGYGQHEQKMADIERAYIESGGTVAYT